jgi:hypothetical protein
MLLSTEKTADRASGGMSSFTVADMANLMAKASSKNASTICSYCQQSRDYELASHPPNQLCQYCEIMCDEHHISKTMTRAEIQQWNSDLIEKTSSKIFSQIQDVSEFTFMASAFRGMLDRMPEQVKRDSDKHHQNK